MTATYRLQLHAGFTFADAEARIPYFARLGVTHLYLSPVLQAVHGSMHGYDVLDHTLISDDLGGEEGLLSLADDAHRQGLGLVVDVVPNHMALVAPEHLNHPLWQVLRDGPEAATAHWFDIDWTNPVAGEGKLGLPVLGSPLADVLAAGEITLGTHAGAPVLRYFDHEFPVARGTEGSDVADVLDRQHYRLAGWREAPEVLNYRRFFDVTELIAVRVELPDVFDETHRVLLDLHHRGVIDGFRIDHPDGLADPQAYLARLREATRPGTPIWVEKILEGDEHLPEDWPCDGTTGYDAMLAVTTALADPASDTVLDETWAATGAGTDLGATVEEAKREVVAGLFGAEVQRLTRRASEALPGEDAARLAEAITELLVAGDVYRAYIRPGEEPDALSRERFDEALALAVRARPDLVDVLEKVVALALPGERRDAAADDFAVRFQQTWGPVMAKGIEDTTFYRWHRLVALNEVGGDPGLRASAEPLHRWAAYQQEHWPRGMTTLSTHDTKRSEDVRARILAIAGDPDGWQRCSQRFAAAAHGHGLDLPTAHLVWQTLVGVGAISTERLTGYLTKAVREAKQHTTWTEVDEGYEARVMAFAEEARASLGGLVSEVVDANREAIRATVLGQKLLQLTLPGIPDIYQGCELVELSLVDPDNRRPVHYEDRARRLDRLLAGESCADLDDEKLLVVHQALALRAEQPEAFGDDADYLPLASGSEHVVGFVRGGQAATLVTRAPQRLAAAGGWQDESVLLPDGSWRDRLTGAAFSADVRLADLFATRPVALLEVHHG